MSTIPACTFSQQDWDVYARCYDGLLQLSPYRALCAEVATFLSPTVTDVILDAGCGTGNILKAIRSSCREVALYGVDLSPSMLARAKKKLSEAQSIVLLRANLDALLPFSKHTFTKVSSVNVLYAVPNPSRTLLELYRVLQPGGILAVVTPKIGYDNGYILKNHAKSSLPDEHWIDAHGSVEREEKLIREAIQDEVLVQSMLHIARHNRLIARNATFHFFTEKEITALVAEAGFTDVRVTSTYANQAFFVVAKKESLQ